MLIALSTATTFAQVPYQRIASAENAPSDWLTYSGNYQAHRFSPLTEITRQNVAQLKPFWIYQVRRSGIVETSPIVADGIMYITEPPSTVTALDVRTGRPLWTWTPAIPTDVIIIGSPPVNRGVAVSDEEARAAAYALPNYDDGYYAPDVFGTGTGAAVPLDDYDFGRDYR